MPETIGQEFMEKTRYTAMGPSAQSQGAPQPPLELPYDPDAVLVVLPDAEEIRLPSYDLRRAIEERRTKRRYSPEAISQTELAYLLWLTQGVKEVTQRPATLRTVPSAGARHAFETYLLINRVEGLQPGLYRYIALEHALLPVSYDWGLADQLAHACNDQKQITASAVTFIWVAVVERMTWRYGQRGYRYMHLDAGHVCQNLYLAGESIGCDACAIAAFDDQLLNQTMQLDGENQFVIYMASLGKKQTAGGVE